MTRNRPPFQLTAKVDEADVKANEPIRSRSDAPSMGSLLQARVSRRATLRGGFGLAAVTLFAGAGLAGCSSDDDDDDDGDNGAGGNTAAQLSFASVPNSKADQVVVPEGYQVDVLIPWGTPIVAGAAAFNPATNTAADQAGQTGMHHDGMYLFQTSDAPDQGLLAINHENISRKYLFPNGRTENENGRPTVPDEVRREGTDGEEPVNAANPRDRNTYGHIIRQEETGGDPAATTFTWDIFVFGAPAGAEASVNISGLTEANQFGSPDRLWFDRRGVLWIQTDNGGNAVAEATNNQMLAVIPASLPEGRLIRPETQASLKRFLVGPTGCEITGSDLSADGKTLFANVQHPSGNFPDYDPDLPPRSATLAIRREDGGEIAL